MPEHKGDLMREPEGAPQPERAKPYAGWSSVGFGLVALAFSLWVLFTGDFVENFLHTPKDDPLLIAGLVNGILGTLAGIVGIARHEPKRLALLGLGISLVALTALAVMSRRAWMWTEPVR